MEYVIAAAVSGGLSCLFVGWIIGWGRGWNAAFREMRHLEKHGRK